MSQIVYPRLSHLFGAFFHQDWEAEGRDWSELVRNFSQDRPRVELEATAAEMYRLLVDFSDDAALNCELFRVLGCEYDPRPDLGGSTVRVWLDRIAASLRLLAELADERLAVQRLTRDDAER